MYLLGNSIAIFVVNYELSTFRHTHMLTCLFFFHENSSLCHYPVFSRSGWGN